MSRSFALLTLAAFALSAPLNARTLLATDEAPDSIETVPIDAVQPECLKTSAEDQGATNTAGGMPDTSAVTAEASITSCCWVFWAGRWWCMPCA